MQKFEEDDEKSKWDKLDKYKCYICKEEFYFVKKDFEDKISEDEFAKEPFVTLPIFINEGKCPFCKASKKNLIYIMSEDEKKAKREKEQLEKKAAKEKLKEQLEKLKEEEERLDKLHSEQIGEMCKEIFSDTMDYLKELEISLRKGELTIDRFETLLIGRAFDIMQRDIEVYNKRNREISLILSNSFKTGFREAILDFNLQVRNSLKNMERSIENIDEKVEELKGSLELTYREINQSEAEKDSLKDEFKQDIDDAKNGKRGLGDDFLTNLKKELR